MKKWIYLSFAIIFTLIAIALLIWYSVLYCSIHLKDRVVTPEMWAIGGSGLGCIVIAGVFGFLFYLNAGDDVVYKE